jgi:hypothetical protein
MVSRNTVWLLLLLGMALSLSSAYYAYMGSQEHHPVTAYALPVVAPKQPRVLVIVIGQARGSSYAWNSLYKYLLAPYQADLATFFTESSPVTVLQRMARFNWVVPEFTDWAAVMTQVERRCGVDSSWHALCRGGDQWLGGATVPGCIHDGSAGILLAFRWLVQQKLMQHNLLDQYDYMVLSRADELYLCDHVPFTEMDTHSVWLPFGEEYDGYSDRHLVATPTVFMRALNITTELVCNWQAYSDTLRAWDHVNLERLQKQVWEQTGVPVRQYRRSMFTVKTPEDPTRWGKGTNLVEGQEFGLLIKYPDEMVRAKEHCQTTMQEVLPQLLL